MKKRIALITSHQQRHRWVATQLAAVGDLVAVVCEAKPVNSHARSDNTNQEIATYFQERESREAYWFADAAKDMGDLTPSVLRCTWGQGNAPETYDFLVREEPEIVFFFGSSIIRDPILSHFKGRVINMHLGLSPYYRGSSTNFWPLVDGLPECVGVTVHHATLKVDGGNILLQARPEVESGDSSHDLGCKTIIAGASLFQKVTQSSTDIPEGVAQPGGGKLCRRDDFSLDSLRQMQSNLSEGMIRDYVNNKESRDGKYPIIDSVLF